MKLSRRWVVPVLVLACAACSRPPVTTPPAPFESVTTASSAAAAPASPSPGPSPSAAASPSPAAVPAMRIDIPSSHTPAVGTSIDLAAVPAFESGGAIAGTTWSLDDGDDARAILTPTADGGRCSLSIKAPGTIRVTATNGGVTAQAIVVGVATPAPATELQLPDQALAEHTIYPGTPGLIGSADDWTRYWQGVLAYKAQTEPYGGGLVSVPALPPDVDFGASSLVVFGNSFGSAHEPPVVASVADGEVLVGMPDVNDGKPVPAMAVNTLHVYRIARASRLVYDCRSQSCTAPSALPTPDALGGLRGTVVGVGEAFSLPAEQQGVKLTWSLGSRTASRATLQDNVLTATSPGGIVLDVTDGQRSGHVFEVAATTPRPELVVPPNGMGAISVPVGQPMLFNDAASWQAYWLAHWYAPGTGADQPWTAPPPPPAAPVIDFTTSSLLAAQLPGTGNPVISSITGNTVHVAFPGSTLATAQPSSPTYLFQLPKLAGPVTVDVETFPEASATM